MNRGLILLAYLKAKRDLLERQYETDDKPRILSDEEYFEEQNIKRELSELMKKRRK